MVNTRQTTKEADKFIQSINNAVDKLGAKFNKEALPKLEDDTDLSQVNWMDVKSLDQAEKKAIQGPLIHPFFLIVEWLFRAVCFKVSTWWNKAQNQENKEIMLNCHSLKNRGHLSPNEFITLQKAVSDKDEFRKLTATHVEKLKDSGFIDIKAHRAISSLILADNVKDVWVYLNTISVLNNLTSNMDQVKEILGPKESLKLLNTLNEAFKTSIFNGKATTELSELLARVEVSFWLDSFKFPEADKTRIESTIEDYDNNVIDSRNLLYRAMQKALKSNDKKDFQQNLKWFFEYAAERCENPLRRYYYEDMAKSLEGKLIGENVFVHLSHSLMTEAFMETWESEFSTIHDEILNTDKMGPDQLKDLNPRLVKLYEVFGHVLDAEKEYVGSDTLYAQTYGKLKSQWKDISDKMHSFNDGEISSHDLCGCINHKLTENSSRPWPSSATTVISASNYKADHHEDKAEKKKVMCVTCSWGGGHRAVSSALEQYLGSEDYHFSAIDGPQEMLIEEDLLQKHLGGDFTITKLYNTLVANKAWRTLSFIRKFSSSSLPTDVDPVQKKLVMQRVLMEKPDIIVAAYSQHVHLLVEVGKELGIPVVYTSTDLHQEYPSWKTPVDYKHFRMIVPSKEPSVMKTFNAPVPKKQVLGLGYPSRPAFSKNFTKAELNQIYQKFNLPKDKKLIMIMAGACGAESPYTEKVLRKMKQGKYQDCHLVVICGNNKSYYSNLKGEIESEELKDHASALGFIKSAEDMAKLMSVSDCLITKPGGSSVAEAVSRHLKLVLEVNPDDTLAWEKFAATWVKDKGLGSTFNSYSEFFEALETELEKEKPTVDALPLKQPQEKSYSKVISDLIKGAEKDKKMQEKREVWEDDLHIKLYKPVATKGYRMETAQVDFNQGLKDKVLSDKLTFNDSIVESLMNNKPIQINFTTNRLEEVEKFSETETLLLVQKLSKHMENVKFDDEGKMDVKDEILHFIAGQLLVNLDTRIKKGEITKRSLKEEISRLDRICTYVGLKGAKVDEATLVKHYKITDAESSRVKLEALEHLFKTGIAKSDFKKWHSEKTSSARKKGLDQYIMSPKTAALSFLFQPSSVDFVKNLHLHRSVSAYNQVLKLDGNTGDLMIRLEGEDTPVSEIKNDFHFFQNRIIDSDGKEFFYFEDEGLRVGSPTEWGDSVPVFRKKDKVRKTPHLEICTIIGPEVHSYIKMKGKNGEVYSVGKFWDRNVDLPGYTELLKTVPAMLRMDYHDYLPHEKYFKKTKVEMTEKKFDEILSYIKSVQTDYMEQEGGFNIFNANCSGFTKHIAEKAGVDMGDTKISVLEYVTGGLASFPSVRKFLFKHKWLRRVSDVIMYPIAVLRNLLIYALGGRDQIGHENLKKDTALKSFKDIFDPFAGSVDHPIGIRTWQEIQEDKAKAILEENAKTVEVAAG